MKKQAKTSFLSIIINILIPSMVLVWAKKIVDIDPIYILIVALSFPFVYAITELILSKKWSLISILGFISILLTGSIAILELPPQWIAVKESLIPFCLGAVMLVSTKTKSPGMSFLANIILNVEKIQAKALENNKLNEWTLTLKKSTLFLSIAFLVSTILNFLLAFYIVKSPPGSVEFNNEMGVLTVISYPVIAIPALCITAYSMWYLVKKIKDITQYSLEDVISDQLK